MRFLPVLLLAILVPGPTHARVVWHDDAGFSLTTVGWVDQDVFPDWIGIRMKLDLPPGGYAEFARQGSLEFFLPCRGWVADLGVVIAHGCAPDPRTGRDTLGSRGVAVTREMECEEYGSVLMVARIPRMFPTRDCRPTQARWVKGGCHVENQ